MRNADGGLGSVGMGVGVGPRRAELGVVAGLDLHAKYYADRTGGDFFDAVRVGSRVVFLLSDIAGRRAEADPIALATQEVFRARAAELFGPEDANLMDGTALLVQAVNGALMGAAKGVRFAPTFLGCYDVQLGLLAYINGGGQTAVISDSEGTRALGQVAMPLGLFSHLTFEPAMQAFEPGARLVVVTKGVTESKHGGVRFGPERVMAALDAGSASEVCEGVLEAAAGYQKKGWLRLGRKVMVEDMTALAMVRGVEG